MYKISEKNFKLIGQAVSSYSDHRLRKNGFEKNAFKVLSTICMQIETAPFKVIYLHK